MREIKNPPSSGLLPKKRSVTLRRENLKGQYALCTHLQTSCVDNQHSGALKQLLCFCSSAGHTSHVQAQPLCPVFIGLLIHASVHDTPKTMWNHLQQYLHATTLTLCALMLMNLTNTTQNASALFHEPSSVLIASGYITSNFLTSSIQAYQLIQPDVNISIITSDDITTKDLINSNQVDIAFFAGAKSPQDAAEYPDAYGYPQLSTGVAPVYNLPGMPPGFILTLSPMTMSLVLLGHITEWDDPKIVTDNALQLNGAVLPNQPIQLIPSNFTDATNYIMTYGLNDVNPSVGMTVGLSYLPNWANVTYMVQPIYTSTFFGNCIQSQLVPYSLSYASASAAGQLGVPLGNMINKAGVTVSLTSDSLEIAAIEMGVHAIPTVYNDFSNAASVFAWPVAGPIMLVYNHATVRTTCLAKQQAYEFITWFQSSTAVVSLANNVGIIPPIVSFVSDFPSVGMLCGSTPVQSQATTTGRLAGSDALGTFTNEVLSFYQGYYAGGRTYTFQQQDQLNSLAQLLNGEIDVAIVEPDYLNYTNLAEWTQYATSGDLAILPAAVQSAVPTFNLPSAIKSLVDPTRFKTTLYGNNIGNKPGLGLDPLTLAAIYTGNINDWTHPNISYFNPWLAERVEYLQKTTPNLTLPITLVICCDEASASTSAAQIIALGLLTTLKPESWYGTYNMVPDGFDYGRHVANDYHRWQIPFDWHTNLTQLGNSIRYQMIAHESQLGPTTSVIDGAISYYVTPYPHQQLQSEMSVLYNPDPGVPSLEQTVWTWSSANVEGMLSCVIAQASDDLNLFSLQLDSPNQVAACWQFSMLVSYAVLSHYDDTFPIRVPDANNTLNLIQWLVTDQGLQAPASARDVGLLSMLPDINSEVVHSLQYVLCNGQNCLITLPTIWTVSTGVIAFGYGLGATMLLICSTTAVLVWWYRRRVVIRSASVQFLLLMLVGLSMMFLACMILVQTPPTESACSAFAWLINLGLEMTFVPLFLKMYRIYRIFSRKKLKVVKITDTRLSVYGLILITFDILVMATWQGTNPLRPIVTHVYSGVNDQQYLQCNTTDYTYVSLLGAEKAVLLLFGCVMSFSTRKVSGTFNESTSVAWSIYNTILATVILLPIIAFVNALGDTLIILVLLMILWIGVSIYCFIFVTKMYAITQGDANGQVSMLESQRTLTGGFSFVSVDALTVHTIDQYLQALRKHLLTVESKQSQLNGQNEHVRRATLSQGSASHPTHRTATSGDVEGDPTKILALSRQTSNRVSITSDTQKKYLASNQYTHQQVAPVRRQIPSFLSHATLNNGSIVECDAAETDK